MGWMSSNQNLISCLQNSSRRTADSALTPLLNALTGEAIQAFPINVATIRAARGKSPPHAQLYNNPNDHLGAEVNRWLQALQMPVDGTLEDRRDRLLTTIGVTSLVVGQNG